MHACNKKVTLIYFFNTESAVISAFSSIGIVALPAGILAGSFTEKFRKKKWINKWKKF